MKRKLYALFVLIGSVGAIVLFYMYFFVYYTAQIEIQSNINHFEVKLFNASLAQNYQYTCTQNPCILLKVPPLVYNATFSAQGYEDQSFEIEVHPRKNQEIKLNFEKKLVVQKQLLQDILSTETQQERIERLKTTHKFEKVFSLEHGTFGIQKQDNKLLLIFLDDSEKNRTLWEFPLVSLEEIRMDDISASPDIFLDFAGKYFMYQISQNSLISLPYELNVLYVKKAPFGNVYHIVTENGSFYYDISEKKSQYQYVFQDFVQMGNMYLGIIPANDTEKRKNYNITKGGNLIVSYDSQSKKKRVLYSQSDSIQKIFWKADTLLIESDGEIFEIKNY